MFQHLMLLVLLPLYLPVCHLLSRLYGRLHAGLFLVSCLLLEFLLPFGPILALGVCAVVGVHAYREEQRRLLGDLDRFGSGRRVEATERA